ncbi:MAG: hypothetical protein MZU79_04615 [Anaerotruncus sp.]|nr:hypothetical protein [Anaerotruncus sp.]
MGVRARRPGERYGQTPRDQGRSKPRAYTVIGVIKDYPPRARSARRHRAAWSSYAATRGLGCN